MLLYFLSCYSCCFYCLFGFTFFIMFLLKIKSLTFVLAEGIWEKKKVPDCCGLAILKS